MHDVPLTVHIFSVNKAEQSLVPFHTISSLLHGLYAAHSCVHSANMSDITDAYDLQVQECIVTAAEFEEEKAEIAREQTAKEAELAAIRTKIEESLNEDFKEKEIGIRETKKLLLGCDLGNLDLLTQLTGQIKDLDRVDQHRKVRLYYKLLFFNSTR